MAFETSSYASSSSQSNDAPKELLQLLRNLNKQQKQQQQQQQRQQLLEQFPQPENEDQQDLHKMQQQQQQREQQQQHVELSQIELIYRAEGNANLVLALPQFKKVLRLPKMQQKQQQKQPKHNNSDRTLFNQKYPQQNKQEEEEEKQQQNQQEPTDMTLTTTTTGQYEQQQQQHNENAVGILTMDHYVAYIAIIRCLLGNEFVYEADIVAVPNPNDRDWINEHIRPYRPVNRLDKEFGGHYGLLLPDATGLPTEFDILFSNLQSTTRTTREATPCCSCHVDGGVDVTGGNGHNIFGEDTYAIEIKPKQGWLLPNNVNNLFDIKPTTEPPTFKVPMPPAAESCCSSSSKEPLKISTDKEYLTAIQNLTSASAATSSSSASSIYSTATSLSTSSALTRATVGASRGHNKNSHLLHEMADIRCRYCSMQHLKLKQQKINEISKYCPMDLFSGLPHRMIMSLDALFMCPQNNLRIYKNGILIFDDKISHTIQIGELFSRYVLEYRRGLSEPAAFFIPTYYKIEKTESDSSYKLQLIKKLLVSCLLRDKDDAAKDFVKVRKDEHNDVHVVSDSQPHSSMTFSETQKVNIFIAPTTATASTSTSAGAVIITTETEVTEVNKTFVAITQVSDATTSCTYSTCDMICPIRLSSSTTGDVSVGQMNTPEMPTLPKNCVLQKILHLQLLAKRNFQYMLDHKYQVKREKSFDSLRKLLKKFVGNANKLKISQLEPDEQYLLAATALDCSIMITFRSICHCSIEHSSFIENPHVICLNDQKFVTKVTLLDLDPKPDSHFAKYCDQTKEILKILQ